VRAGEREELALLVERFRLDQALAFRKSGVRARNEPSRPPLSGVKQASVEAIRHRLTTSRSGEGEGRRVSLERDR